MINTDHQFEQTSDELKSTISRIRAQTRYRPIRYTYSLFSFPKQCNFLLMTDRQMLHHSICVAVFRFRDRRPLTSERSSQPPKAIGHICRLLIWHYQFEGAGEGPDPRYHMLLKYIGYS